MSVTTGTGDQGQTGLWSGQRVDKDDPRVEAYGTVDELNSWIGLCSHEVSDTTALGLLDRIKKDLFRVGGQLATEGRLFDHPITSSDSDFLREKIQVLEKELDLTGFVFPGLTKISAALDIARTIARRAERRTVSVIKKIPGPGLAECLVYLNRVSDLLFILARREEKKHGNVARFEF